MMIHRIATICALALVIAVSVHAPARGSDADEAVEALDRLGNFIFTLRDYVDTLSAGEMGERQFLEQLARTSKTSVDVKQLCGEQAEDMASGSKLLDYRPVASGLLGEMRDVDLVRLAREHLSFDGYTFLSEDDAWGTHIIYLDAQPPGQPWSKRYILLINQGFQRQLSDLFHFRDTNGSYCFIKAERF